MDATIAAYAALGLTAGVLSGMVGIGGGILIVPALVFLFGLSQHQAQGTTLALLVPPIGFLGAWTYYRQGYVDLRLAALIAVGFFLGSLFGARLSVGLSDKMLARVFGSAVVLIGAKMLLGR
ncbi:MAG TPA: sulfite exporter TauE/SafE family protein [Dehalococcoidia bacterium]